jgi:hypothetical protein
VAAALFFPPVIFTKPEVETSFCRSTSTGSGICRAFGSG